MENGGRAEPIEETRSAASVDMPRLLRHVPALDGLRGLAVLLVVETHLMIVFDHPLFYSLLPGAALGVDIFFVLSGFLITSLLLGEMKRSGRVSMRGFYARRARRLLPALLVLLAIHVAYTALTGRSLDVELHTVVASLLYVANWYQALGRTTSPGMSHLWSLSVEEQFYLVWPMVAVILFGSRRSFRFVVSTLCVVIVAIVLWRYVLWNDATTFVQRSAPYYRTDTRADGLLLGALVAYLWMHRRIPKRGLGVAAWCSTAFIGLCVCRWVTDDRLYFEGGFALVALGAAIVIVALVDGQWSGARLFTAVPLRAVGRISYGLYLWHPPVFFVVYRYLSDWPKALEMTFAVVMAFVMTLASWFVVERPFMRWRRNTLGGVSAPTV